MLKKALVVAAMGGVLIATNVSADMLMTDVDTADAWSKYSAYWDGDDTNQMELANSSKAAEENWIEALLGLQFDDPSVEFIAKEAPGGDITMQQDYYPGFSWDFVIVKAGRKSFAFEDTGDDDLLSFNLAGYEWRNAISHQSYFRHGQTGSPVPEPATLLFMGMGVTALAARMRKKR